MLGIGGMEMLVIGVVGLIVIGPRDLPVVLRKIGKFVAQVKQMGQEFQREVDKATGLGQARAAVGAPLERASADIRRQVGSPGGQDGPPPRPGGEAGGAPTPAIAHRGRE